MKKLDHIRPTDASEYDIALRNSRRLSADVCGTGAIIHIPEGIAQLHFIFQLLISLISSDGRPLCFSVREISRLLGKSKSGAGGFATRLAKALDHFPVWAGRILRLPGRRFIYVPSQQALRLRWQKNGKPQKNQGSFPMLGWLNTRKPARILAFALRVLCSDKIQDGEKAILQANQMLKMSGKKYASEVKRWLERAIAGLKHLGSVTMEDAAKGARAFVGRLKSVYSERRAARNEQLKAAAAEKAQVREAELEAELAKIEEKKRSTPPPTAEPPGAGAPADISSYLADCTNAVKAGGARGIEREAQARAKRRAEQRA